MTRIDGFNPNLPQVTPKVVSINKSADEQPKQAETSNKNTVSGDDTLKYMANTAGYVPVETPKQSEVNSKTVIPVSQFVTPEQAQRIAGSVQKFQGLYNSISTTAQNELNIPKELADKVALETIEDKYMLA
ncbi:MAG: hypothetical protein PHC34_00190 [Candidatus Gastranaerophilales bacterium]|nr:hypothetical protein [Candidatus Gastranaerophilales bacterium]